MRKILCYLILLTLLILAIIFVVNGFPIGSDQKTLYGTIQIKAEDEKINKKIEELNDIKNNKYAQASKALEKASEYLENTKQSYEDKAVLLGDSKYYLQTEEYEIEFLWTKLGNYAKDENVEIKIDVANSQITGRYNLNFEVFGAYTDVTQFIYDIENDSKLGFKIENFSMKAGGTVSQVVNDGETVSTQTGVIGTFTCKELRIKLDKNVSNSTGTINNSNTTTSKNTTDVNNGNTNSPETPENTTVE